MRTSSGRVGMRSVARAALIFVITAIVLVLVLGIFASPWLTIVLAVGVAGYLARADARWVKRPR